MLLTPALDRKSIARRVRTAIGAVVLALVASVLALPLTAAPAAAVVPQSTRHVVSVDYNGIYRSIDEVFVDTALAYWGFFGVTPAGRLRAFVDSPSYTPSLVPPDEILDLTVTKVAAGYENGAVLDEDGHVHAWGQYETYPNPTPVTVPEDIAEEQFATISASYSGFLGVTTDGRLRSWGALPYGEADFDSDEAEGQTFVDASLGEMGALAITDEGKVLRAGFMRNYPLPAGLDDEVAVAVEVGNDGGMALTEEGNAYSWGASHLADIPDEVADAQVVAINAGYDTAAAVTADGRYFYWGTGYNVEVPTPRPGLRIVDVALTRYNAVVMYETLGPETGPTLSGTPQVDVPLTVDPGTWYSEPDSVSYAWTVDGDPVGADEPTYTPTGADFAGELQVTVTAVKDGAISATASTDPVAVIANTFSVEPTASISGVAKVGETLTVEVTDPTPTAELVGIWLRDDDPIDGAEGTSYTLTSADEDAVISYWVAAIRDGYEAVYTTSDPVGPVALGEFADVEVSIDGVAAVGSRLSASVDGVPEPESVQWRWLRDGEPIDGATDDSYELVAADHDAEISVEATVARDGYASATVVSDPVGPVALGEFADVEVLIDGVAAVGARLTASVEGTPEPESVAYQWLRDGEPIAEATEAEYDVVAADRDALLQVEVTVSRAGYQSATVASDEVGPVEPLTLTDLEVSVDGTAAVGQTLTATASSQPAAESVQWRWLRDGEPIDGAIEDSYELVAADHDAVITAEATLAKPRYGTEVVVSDPVGPVGLGEFTVTPEVSIDGVAQVGETLTAQVSAAEPAAESVEYEWLRDGEPITGAEAETYTLVAADAGARISVRITVSRDGYQTAQAESAETAPVSTRGFDVAPTARLAGTARVGSTLTVTVTAPAGASVQVQWHRDGTAIRGATQRSYRLTKQDYGTRLHATVSVQAPGFTAAELSTARSAPVAAGPVKLKVKAKKKVRSGKKVKLRIRKLMPGERVTIRVGKKRITKKANRKGVVRVKVKMRGKGRKKIRIIGSAPDRKQVIKVRVRPAT